MTHAKPATVLAALAILAAALPGCGYLRERGRDLAECCVFEATYGPGLTAGGKIGPLDAALGIVHFGTGFGKIDWWSEPQVMKVRCYPLPLTIGAGFFGDPLASLTTNLLVRYYPSKSGEDRTQRVRESILFVTRPTRLANIEHEHVSGDRVAWFRRSGLSSRQRLVDDFGVDVSAFLLAGGVRLGINALELIDFLAGWFGVEVTGLDDDDSPDEPVGRDDHATRESP